MAIAPFTTMAVELVGRAKETLAVNGSRPAAGSNSTPPVMPSTGTAVNLVPAASGNLIGEIMDTAGEKRVDKTVIATDSTQYIVS